MVAVYDGFVNESIGNLVPCCGYRPVRILSTKIVKLLRLMKILTGNVSMTIDQIAKEMHITPRTIYRYIDNIREAGFAEETCERVQHHQHWELCGECCLCRERGGIGILPTLGFFAVKAYTSNPERHPQDAFGVWPL